MLTLPRSIQRLLSTLVEGDSEAVERATIEQGKDSKMSADEHPSAWDPETLVPSIASRRSRYGTLSRHLVCPLSDEAALTVLLG